MLIKIAGISLLTGMMFLAGCGDDNLAEVNGKDISKAEFSAYLKHKRVPQQDEKRVERMLEDFLQREALATVIEESDVIDQHMVQAELNEFRKQMLISRYFETYLNNNVNAEAVRNYFATNADEFQIEQIKVSHILLRTNDKMSDLERQALLTKAQDVYSKATSGGDFAKLTEQFSEDKISAKKGGSLGWIKRGAIDPVFSEQAFALSAGAISQPFSTPFGFHIVKVEEAAQIIKTPFEKVKGDIRYRLRQQAKQAELERLLSQVDIDRS